MPLGHRYSFNCGPDLIRMLAAMQAPIAVITSEYREQFWWSTIFMEILSNFRWSMEITICKLGLHLLLGLYQFRSAEISKTNIRELLVFTKELQGNYKYLYYFASILCYIENKTKCDGFFKCRLSICSNCCREAALTCPFETLLVPHSSVSQLSVFIQKSRYTNVRSRYHLRIILYILQLKETAWEGTVVGFLGEGRKLSWGGVGVCIIVLDQCPRKWIITGATERFYARGCTNFKRFSSYGW